MLKIKRIFFLIPLLMMVFASCEGHLTLDDWNKNRARESDFFDFFTNRKVTAELDYGLSGSKVLMRFYETDPLLAVDGKTILNPDLNPLHQQFTDASGRLDAELRFPSHLPDSLYLYCSNMGAPLLECCHIVDGKLVNRVYDESPETASTKVVSSPKFFNVSKNDWPSIVKWGERDFGKPVDDNQIKTTGDMDDAAMQMVRNAVWQGKSEKWEGLDNSQYAVKGTEYINTSIRDSYKDENGQIQTVQDAEIFFTFVQESGWNQNVVGYYFYPSDQVPDGPDKVDKYIILPNASIAGNVPYGAKGGKYNLSANDAPVKTNQKFQLLYKDANGKVSVHFPPNTTVGYFIIADGFQLEKRMLGMWYTCSIDYKKDIFYSNKEWNKKERFISRNAGEYLIYGVEDSNDTSYEDIVFTISSSPAKAIINPDEPVVPDDPQEQLIVKQRDVNSYCYEDLWPTTGDYDMNDVIIEHRSSMFFDIDNDLRQVLDTFVVSNTYKSSGEGVKDAFAVIIPTDQRGLMTIPEGAVKEEDTNSIILFENAQEHLGESFVITREFAKGAVSIDDLKRTTDLDPYIINVFPTDAFKYTDDNRREVHFPKKSGTSKINPLYYINDLEAFYVARDNKHPFAICIPLPVARNEAEKQKAITDGSMFVIPEEMCRIDDQYAKPGHEFSSWVESLGEKCADWYKFYSPSK